MRLDGRQPDMLRKVSIERNFIKYAEGSALIAVGDTKVICTASVEEKVPQFLKDTGKGWVTAEYSMLPRSAQVRIIRDSSRGKVSGRSHEIQRLIGRSLRAVVNLEALHERTIWIDCDVIQADGGTRTAAVTGSFIALYDALSSLSPPDKIWGNLLYDSVAATSVGLIGDEIYLDLTYQEDSSASVDMNLVMTGGGKIVEIQGTSEGAPFNRDDLAAMLSVAEKGIRELTAIQKRALEFNEQWPK